MDRDAELRDRGPRQIVEPADSYGCPTASPERATNNRQAAIASITTRSAMEAVVKRASAVGTGGSENRPPRRQLQAARHSPGGSDMARFISRTQRPAMDAQDDVGIAGDLMKKAIEHHRPELTRLALGVRPRPCSMACVWRPTAHMPFEPGERETRDGRTISDPAVGRRCIRRPSKAIKPRTWAST